MGDHEREQDMLRCGGGGVGGRVTLTRGFLRVEGHQERRQGEGAGGEERKDKNKLCLRKDATLKLNYFKLILIKEKKRKPLLAHFFSKSNKIHSFK